MWYLKADNDDRIIYVIPEAQQVVIGRSVDNQVCNFAIPDDPSISRKHATLTVSDNKLFLQDLGSRYGTFVNNFTDKTEINIDVKLEANDTIRFGKMHSVWKVHSLCLNTCTSTLKGESLQQLKQTLSKIGGTLKNEWDDNCNYLTMPAITLTIKVVLALVQGAHIVTTEFWSSFLESVNNFTSMPDPQTFMPTVVESTLNKELVSFTPDSRRKSIFENKKFVFFSRRQFEMYKPILIKSGASPLLLGECKMTVSMLCETNIVVIQYIATGSTQESQTQRNQINDIVNQLKARGRRVIADAEIGLAILYCSSEKYCNPSFSFTSEVVKQSSGPIKSSKILAAESQEPALLNHEKENIKIDESYASDNCDLNFDKQSAKRKLNVFTSEVQFNPNKKIATACFVANIPNESTKRRLSGDEPSSNPSKKIATEIEKNDFSTNSAENKSDEMFNFINLNTANSENKTKKLNLIKPQKRKTDSTREEDNLFNFVQKNEKPSEAETAKEMFASIKIKKADLSDAPAIRNSVTVTSKDISAMRGVKLKELMATNMTNTSNLEDIKVKKENLDLEEKMGGLNLSNTVVITCNNLIVKKEPFKMEPDETSCLVKNFKKFKKVWPVNKQAVVIPSSSMHIVETSSYSVAF